MILRLDDPAATSAALAGGKGASLARMLQAGENMRMTVDLDVRFHDQDLMGYNTIAEIPGTDLKDEVVMVGGHMDSWHAGTGATDNGAGSAAAMEVARILQALRDANVNLLAFSGFPQGRNKAQIDVVTGDLDALKGVARGQKWKLSRIKRAFLVQGTDEAGAAVGPLARLGAANINVIAADAIAAGEGRFGMIFWVEARSYNRAATLLGAA